MSSYMSFPSAGGGHQSPYQQQFPSQPAEPGAITYTTSVGPDGRQRYHAFRAEAASYRTEQGIIPGIQWVPTETEDSIPRGAQPANSDWIRRWGRERNDPDQQREWLREEEKRAKKEQKEMRKELKEYGKAEEKLAKIRNRERRQSMSSGMPAYSNYGYNYPGAMGGGGGAVMPMTPNGMGAMGMGGGMPMQPAMAGGYLAAGEPVPGRPRRLSQSTLDIDRHMAELDLNNHQVRRKKSMSSRSGRERRVSFSGSGGRSGTYVGNDGREEIYGSGGSLYGGDFDEGSYPPDHIMSLNQSRGMGMPMPAQRSPTYSYSGLPSSGSLSAQRMGGGMGVGVGASPYSAGVPQQLMGSGGMGGGGMMPTPFSLPESFSRMPSSAHPYTMFEPMLVAHMDDILIEIPRLPAVMTPHDIGHHDWIRFIQDVAQAWSGQVNIPNAHRPPRRSKVAANIIDTWNTAFFLPRYIEVVLVKGRTRCSGPTAGHIDPRLVRAVEEALDDSSTSSSDDSDDSDSERDRYGYERGYGFYGNNLPGNNRWMSDTATARRQWRNERKGRKSHSHKDRRKRREAEERRQNRYSLYVMCVR